MIGTSHKVADIPIVIGAQRCSRPVYEVILHHTWAPTAAQYQGKRTIDGIYNYHTAENGWSDIGYHYLIAPDGTLWLGRPLDRDGAHVLNHNANTVGVSMILNGDVELPSPAQAAATSNTLRALLKRFGLAAERNFGAGHGFHRDYSSKTCPGTQITKAIILGWLLTSVSEPPTAEPDDGGDQPPAWAAESIARLQADGITDGSRPNAPATRAEVMVLLDRALRLER